MTLEEIQELFILAAEIDRRLPISVRPAQVKSLSLPFVHSFEERRDWEPADMAAGEVLKDSNGKELSADVRLRLKKALKDKLELGDKGRRALEADQFWNGARITHEEVGIWEKANDLIRHVPTESKRRALLHWAIAIAGGRPFARWCRDEGILPETGRWRKESALKEIYLRNACVEFSSTHECANPSDLSNLPKISDKNVNIEEPRREYKWMSDGSKPLASDIDIGLAEYDWAAEQNARRRQREAKRRQQQAA